MDSTWGKCSLCGEKAQTTLKCAAENEAGTKCRKVLGKPYDIYFEWDDRAIYCSEIVWKAYQHALGIELSAVTTT